MGKSLPKGGLVVITLQTPLLPDMKHLGGNARRRGKWQVQWAYTEKDKKRWYEALVEQVIAIRDVADAPWVPWENVNITISVVWPNRIRRDFDNAWAALKPLIDVLSSPDRIKEETLRLGLIADDRWPVVRSERLEFYYGKPGYTRIRIERDIHGTEAIAMPGGASSVTPHSTSPGTQVLDNRIEPRL